MVNTTADRRGKVERRIFSYTAYSPERRTGKDRRGKSRKNSEDTLKGERIG